MNINDVLGFASNLIGVGSFVFALLAWIYARRTQRDLAYERERMNQNVEVVLVLAHDNRHRELPVALRRIELTRAEVLGRLGMMQMREAGKRFSLRYLSTPEFLQQLNAAQAAKGKFTVEIPCANTEEFEQFAD